MRLPLPGLRNLRVLTWQSLGSEVSCPLILDPASLCHVPFVCPIHFLACGTVHLWDLLLSFLSSSSKPSIYGLWRKSSSGFCLACVHNLFLQPCGLPCSHNSLAFANQKPWLSRLMFSLFMSEVCLPNTGVDGFRLCPFLPDKQPTTH